MFFLLLKGISTKSAKDPAHTNTHTHKHTLWAQFQPFAGSICCGVIVAMMSRSLFDNAKQCVDEGGRWVGEDGGFD